MIDHFGVQSDDVPAATAWYDAFFAPLGFGRVMDFGVAVGYGPPEHPYFWVSAATDPGGRQAHIAFTASGEQEVERWHEAALHNGGTDNGPPGLRPEYSGRYYAAFVIDPDGNNVEAVYHTPPVADSTG